MSELPMLVTLDVGVSKLNKLRSLVKKIEEMEDLLGFRMKDEFSQKILTDTIFFGPPKKKATF
jgi:hypothetical protein